jgi:aminopeptidase N
MTGARASATLGSAGAALLTAVAIVPRTVPAQPRLPLPRDEIGVVQFARAEVPHPYQPGIDVLDYAIALVLPDSGRAIEGRATLTVRRLATVDTLVLDLTAMRVISVSVGGADIGARYVRDSATVRVPLPAGMHDTLRVEVRYAGSPADGLIIRTDAHGRWTAFGDNWPNRARLWIPSVDHPSDKATVSWDIIAPSDRRVVANGELLLEAPLPVTRGGRPSVPRTRWLWREERPIPVHLMVIAAAPLAAFDLGRTACGLADSDGCVRQTVYAAPEVVDFLPGPFTQAAGITNVIARLVGPFPYEKLAHVQSSTRFGGMENASAIFYGDNLFSQRTLRAGTIAHEIAHQWFGDAVTQREWAHAWLSEGFASYFEQVWVQQTQGDTAIRAGMRRMRDEVIKAPVVATRSVIDSVETDLYKLLTANTYQKGAWTLHMLRATVGDSAFFRGVRAYYARHKHSTAMSDDLRRAVERYAGVELSWFFDQWLRRPGFPEVTVRWSYDAKAKRLTLDVDQAPRFGAFQFALDVAIVDGAGRQQRHTVHVPAERHTSIRLPATIGQAPRTIVVDPDVRLLGTFTVTPR